MQLTLAEFPDAIAEFERRLNLQNRQISTLLAAIVEIEGEVDGKIAFDANLKNDAQRKAKRTELLAESFYQKCLADCEEAQDRRREVEIDLERLQNLFTIAKLQMRHETAQLEQAIA